MIVASLIDDAFIHICLFLTADEVLALSRVNKRLHRIVDGEEGYSESSDLLWDLLFHRDVPAVLHGITVQAMRDVFGDTAETDYQVSRGDRSAQEFFKRMDALFVELRAQEPQPLPINSPTQSETISGEHQELPKLPTRLPTEAQSLEDNILTESTIDAFRATTSWKKAYFTLREINGRPSLIQAFNKTLASPFSFFAQGAARPCFSFVGKLFGEVDPLRVYEIIPESESILGQLAHRRRRGGRGKRARGVTSPLTAAAATEESTAPLAILLRKEHQRFCSFRASPLRAVKTYNHYWSLIVGKLPIAQAGQDSLTVCIVGYIGTYLHLLLNGDWLVVKAVTKNAGTFEERRIRYLSWFRGFHPKLDAFLDWGEWSRSIIRAENFIKRDTTQSGVTPPRFPLNLLLRCAEFIKNLASAPVIVGKTFPATLAQQQSTLVPLLGIASVLRLARLVYCPFYHQSIKSATVLALLAETVTDNLSFVFCFSFAVKTLTPAIKGYEILFRDVFMKFMQPFLPMMVCGMTFFNTCPRAALRAGPSPLRTKLLVKAVASSVVALVVSGLMLRKFPLHNVLYGLVRPLFRLSLWLAGTSLSAIPIDQAKRGDETAVIVLAGIMPCLFSLVKAFCQANAFMVFDELPPKLTKESLSRSMKAEERCQLGLDDSDDDSEPKARPPLRLPKKALNTFSVATNALLRLQNEKRFKFRRQVTVLSVSRFAEELLLTLVSVGLLVRDGNFKRALCFRAGAAVLLRVLAFGAATLLPERLNR